MAVGKKMKKVDSESLVMGKPLYTDDLVRGDNPLIIVAMRSPYGNAIIKSIDTKNAMKVEGVEAIFTYKDVPKTRHTVAGQSAPEICPFDRLILDSHLRYVGDEVALIAASSEKIARKAMKLIKVDYEVLEPLIDYEKALDSDILVHEYEYETVIPTGIDTKRNISAAFNMEKEGVDDGFLESDHIIERTYYMKPQIHNMMEGYRAYSYIDNRGRICVIGSTQVPFHTRRHIARALELPVGKVKVIKPQLGGGFGGKQTTTAEIYSAFVTLKTGKPSKMIYSRVESNTCTTTRHAMRIKVKIGGTKDGRITAIELDALSNKGAYGEHGSVVTELVGVKSFPLYEEVPMRFTGTVVYTNTVPAGAFRGFGATQGVFALESAVNELASELEIDPIDLRLKNLVEPGEGKNIVSGSIKECLIRGREIFNWDERKIPRKTGENKVRGAGVAVTLQGSGVAKLDTATSIIKLNDDGSYSIALGGTDMGQGLDTVMTQIALEVLECDPRRVNVDQIDTDRSPYDPGAYASSGTYVTGNAVLRAARKIRAEVIREGARLLEVDVEEVRYFGDYVEDRDGKRVSIEDIALDTVSYGGCNQLIGKATWGGETSPPPFIAGFAEVEVDTETGVVEVIENLSVVDCGQVINPALAKVQVEGGSVQGVGYALYEDVEYDKNGRIKNDSLMQYNIPTRKDLGKVSVEFVSSYEPTGPFGGKSIGEIVINTPAPAIVAGINSGCGIDIRSIPARSEDIWMKLMEKKEIKNSRG